MMYCSPSILWSQPAEMIQLSLSEASPTAHQRQATRCPKDNIAKMSLRMSPRTTRRSEGSRSMSRWTISFMRASRSSRTMRMMRKGREAFPICATSMPCESVALSRCSAQSTLTTSASRMNHVRRYLFKMRAGRISMTPSEPMYPERKEMGMSRVQKTRVTHSNPFRYGSSLGRSKKPMGIMMRSYSTRNKLNISQLMRKVRMGCRMRCLSRPSVRKVWGSTSSSIICIGCTTSVSDPAPWPQCFWRFAQMGSKTNFCVRRSGGSGAFSSAGPPGGAAAGCPGSGSSGSGRRAPGLPSGLGISGGSSTIGGPALMFVDSSFCALAVGSKRALWPRSKPVWVRLRRGGAGPKCCSSSTCTDS
mmetsp:Transcript_19935/g.56179  ORF Transcript_19935/g.56179 Transcript_19935/m.56179 type:complete len:361 (-) Transcript_19935:458-1540(-)